MKNKNKKLIFIGMLILAAVLTTGAFAYTYMGGATTTLHAAIAGDVYYTTNVSTNQPYWDTLMPSNLPQSHIIRPNAVGDLTENSRYPTTGANWDKVADLTPDEMSTYIYNTSKFYHIDVYSLTDLPGDVPEDVVINKITVYFRFAGGSGTTTGYAKAAIRTTGTTYEGTEQTQHGTIFVTRSYEWATNPATTKKWTRDEINALQAGIDITKNSGGTYGACTQVYIAVDYEQSITEGEIPPGDLFDIAPNPLFTGDMQVKLYLTNTAELIKAYKYLNIELYTANSLEAEKPVMYQVLSLENGVASFNLIGGSAAVYQVEVLGGSYRLVSDEPADWGTGWSLTPEFYCEVTQR